MANSINISLYSGYPTENAVRVWVEMSASKAGSYYSYFEVWDADDNTVATATGSTINMSSNVVYGDMYKTISGLESGTYYTLGAYLRNSAGTTYAFDMIEFTTAGDAPAEPAIYMDRPYSGQTFGINESFTVRATIDPSGLSSRYSAYGIQFFVEGVSIGIAAVNSSWTAATTYSLSRAGSYSIYGRLVNKSSGAYLGYQTGTVTINIEAERPSNWSWTSTVSRGSTMPHWTSGTTTYCEPLTASEWNRFIDRIFDFFEYVGISVSGGGAENFYVSSGNRMYAGETDYARQLINEMDPPTSVPSAISSGRNMTAAYINGLKNSLNSIT